MRSALGQQQSHCGALARGTLQTNLSVMEGRAVLYNGQAQSSAADVLGVALIHPVEPLKHPVLILSGDTDAVILH